MAYLLLDLLSRIRTPSSPLAACTSRRPPRAAKEAMIEVDLTAAAFELVREGVIAKSRKRGVYRVLMPENLAAKLDGARQSGEGMSDVILRLAREAKAPAGRHPFARHSPPPRRPCGCDSEDAGFTICSTPASVGSLLVLAASNWSERKPRIGEHGIVALRVVRAAQIRAVEIVRAAVDAQVVGELKAEPHVHCRVRERRWRAVAEG